MALRSLVETIACIKLIQRRKYFDEEKIQSIYNFSEVLFGKLVAFRKAVSKNP